MILHSALPFNKDFPHIEPFMIEIRKITSDEDFELAKQLIPNIPADYWEEYRNMLIMAKSPQEAFDFLKETYKF